MPYADNLEELARLSEECAAKKPVLAHVQTLQVLECMADGTWRESLVGPVDVEIEFRLLPIEFE